MSIFREMFALAGGVIDTAFGDEFRLVPRRRVDSVNSRFERDPDREPFEFTGSFVSIDDEGHAEGRRMPEKTARASIAPQAAIDVAAAALSYMPKEGDLIRALPAGAWSEIGKVIEDDVGRVSLRLVERQAAVGA